MLATASAQVCVPLGHSSLYFYILFIYFIYLYMKPTQKTVYTMDIKTQRMLLAHRQLQGQATDAAP